jgi:hypothetical protein
MNLAVVGNQGKNLRGKAFRFGIFGPRFPPSKPWHSPCFSTEIVCGRSPRVFHPAARRTPLAATALATKAWYGRAGRYMKVLQYYDTEIRGARVAGDAWAEIWRPFVGYVTYAFSELR